jgi:hypothetical protein
VEPNGHQGDLARRADDHLSCAHRTVLLGPVGSPDLSPSRAGLASAPERV